MVRIKYWYHSIASVVLRGTGLTQAGIGEKTMSRIAHVPSLVRIAFAFSPGLLVTPFQRAMAAAVALPAAQGSDEKGGPTEARNEESVPMVFPVDAGALAELRAVAARSASGGPTERLIYSNTLGINAIRFANGQLVSDDITTTAPVGCKLTRFRFNVLGRVYPFDPGGPFTVRYALYNNCPQAVTSAQRLHYTDEALPNTGIKIRGTDGEITFPDDGLRTVEHIVTDPSAVPIPTNLWLGISFTRSNCGTIVGAPAIVGHSADIIDVTGSLACNSYLGGFPEQPHASFNAQLFGGANCPESFLGYKAARASGPPFNAGSHVPFLDDVKLIVNNCRMIGYEVAVRGQGFYHFELVRDCGDLPGTPAIPGSYKTFLVNLSTQPQLQLARYSFDPPIPLNTDALFFRFIVSNSTAGVVQAGIQPTIGSSSEEYFLVNPSGGCDPVPPAQGSTVTGVFHASITCAGAQPLGACCDPYLTECRGGPDDGKRCRTNDDCAAPGTCEAVCRKVPEINCPFPPSGQDLNPKWKEGAACSPEPFPNTPCGIAACCHLTENPVTHNLDEVCETMTKRECEEAPPLDRPRLWQLGIYCGGPGSQNACPRNPCLEKEGPCLTTHATPGCNDPYCCTQVCSRHGPEGGYCCEVEWDSVCVGFAMLDCITPTPGDSCAPDPSDLLEGTLLIPVPGSVPIDNRHATTSAGEPGFCCHGGVGTCIGGDFNGKACVVQDDCANGFCTAMTPTPGLQGYGTVWFKFVQPLTGLTSALISTCSSNAPAFDSLVQAFKVGDNSTPDNACRSLSVIGCNDDSTGCSSSSRNSRLCLQNLVPGETYYIMVAAKTPLTLGQYRVSVSAGCTGGDVTANDYCPHAATVTDGATPFYINVNTCIGGVNAGRPCTGSLYCPGGTCPTIPRTVTFDCPAELCVPDALNDLWYNYTATCTGQAKFETCGESNETSPDTNLVVYEGCDKCPPVSGVPLGCNDDEFQGCGLGSRVIVDVEQGQCYKVRLSDNQGFPVAGNLTITCFGNDCQPNGMPDDHEIANCPVNDPDCKDCNLNGIPDFCDIRDAREQDCNVNGVPDACELVTSDCQPNGVPDDCDIASGTSLDVNPADGVPDECEPVGACCDWLNTDANGEAVCRDVPLSQCPARPNGDPPQWIEGAACDPDPFGYMPCGIAACCHVTENPYTHELYEVCDNLTKTECEAAPPLDRVRTWQPGESCGLGGQSCPRDPLPVCGENPASCLDTHSTPGCCDKPCCDAVCSYVDPFYPYCPIVGPCLPDGYYCCRVEWDGSCVSLAHWLCGGVPPGNDTCAPEPSPNPNDCSPLPATDGALQIPVPGSAPIDNRNATNSAGESGFCCHGGVSECVDGENTGQPCVVAADCAGGVCPTPSPMPGTHGYGSIWFKFTQPTGKTSALIHTCNSNGPALDSIVEVFAGRDHSSEETACESLVTIGCNDDTPGCGWDGRNSRLCVQNLVPGETYYIMVAAKTPQTMGMYRVNVSTGCDGEGLPVECERICPEGAVHFVSPPDDVVDARRPHSPNDRLALAGIQTLIATGPTNAPAKCWSLCETRGTPTANYIAEVVETPTGTYTITLKRPITPGAVTTLTYTDFAGNATTGYFTSHPANVNGDSIANPLDILDLIDALNGIRTLPWGKYGGDLDRSGLVAPADILEEIDLLNGAGAYAVWNGTPRPQATGVCP